jgi:hypothetical protein
MRKHAHEVHWRLALELTVAVRRAVEERELQEVTCHLPSTVFGSVCWKDGIAGRARGPPPSPGRAPVSLLFQSQPLVQTTVSARHPGIRKFVQ